MQFTFLNSNKYAAINAIKASVAIGIAYLVGLYLGKVLDIDQIYMWVVITVLVVMSTQPNLGGVLGKALMRFLDEEKERVERQTTSMNKSSGPGVVKTVTICVTG